MAETGQFQARHNTTGSQWAVPLLRLQAMNGKNNHFILFLALLFWSEGMEA